MHSLVLGMKHLEKGVDPSGIPVDEVSWQRRAMKGLWQNVRLTIKMIRKAMNEAQVLDLATELCKKTPKQVLGVMQSVY